MDNVVTQVSPSAFNGASLVASNVTDNYASALEIDAQGWGNVSFTVLAATNAIKWTVFGANDSAFATEVTVQAEATILAGDKGYYSATALFAYYRARWKNRTAASVGVGTIYGLLKK